MPDRHPLDSFRELADRLEPPRFDRIAVGDPSIFAGVPEADPHPGAPLLAGWPIVVDEALAPDAVELRRGDEVVERIRIVE